MSSLKQGDFVKVSGFNNAFIVVSNDVFIESTGFFHVCPIVENVQPGALHIPVVGKIKQTKGTVIAEQVKMIDPKVRFCSKFDRANDEDILNIQDAIQCIFDCE